MALAPRYSLSTVGVVRSCFKQKFGIPRQPGLAPAAHAVLEVLPPFDRPEAFRGMEGWSHVWLTFVFHEIPESQVSPEGHKATVHPPRGTEKYGLWATRTTHRPNRLGLSLCELASVDCSRGGVRLRLKGVDLLDGTPVLDIKPYVPYAESVPDAAAAFAPAPPPTLTVGWTAEAEAQLAAAPSRHPAFKELAEQVLRQDPRPTWQQRTRKQPDKVFCLHLADVRVSWRHHAAEAEAQPALVALADDDAGGVPAVRRSGRIEILRCEPLALEDIPSLFADVPPPLPANGAAAAPGAAKEVDP
mmetsp:Transcript_35390/g.92580  ORF Transcript_35390/g.92580 Transcript_35390/m.92580 type:complete len:302 (-) Transcript_35390:1968-2873(-)